MVGCLGGRDWTQAPKAGLPLPGSQAGRRREGDILSRYGAQNVAPGRCSGWGRPELLMVSFPPLKGRLGEPQHSSRKDSSDSRPLCYPVAQAKILCSSLSASFFLVHSSLKYVQNLAVPAPFKATTPSHRFTLDPRFSPHPPLQPCALISAQEPDRPAPTSLRSCLSSEGNPRGSPTHSDRVQKLHRPTKERSDFLLPLPPTLAHCASATRASPVSGPLHRLVPLPPPTLPHGSWSQSLQVPGQMSPLPKSLPFSPHMK